MSVFAYHAAFRSGLNEPPGNPGLVGRILMNLDLGLYLFFALSGYLICRPWLTSAVGPDSGRDWKAYGTQRLLRIVPPLWVLASFIFLAHAGASAAGWTEIRTATWAEALAVFLFVVPQVGRGFTAMMGHAWTLSLELSFYLAVPMLGFAVGPLIRRAESVRRRIAVLLVIVVAIALCSVMARALTPETVAWRRNLVTLGFAFCPGVALALAEVSLGSSARRNLARWSRLPFAVGAVAFALLRAGILGERHDFVPWVSWTAAVAAAASAGCALGFVWASQWADDRIRVPAWPRARTILRSIGRWSYSFYIVHQALILLVADVLGVSTPWVSFVVLLTVGFPVTTAVAALAYRFIERPSIAWARRSSTVRLRGRLSSGVVG